MRRAGKRLAAADYLRQWGGRLFPDYFAGALHPFFCSLLPMDADERAGATIAAFPALLHVMEPSARLEHGPAAPATDSANGSVLRGGAEGEAHSGAVPMGGDGAGAKPGGADGATGREPRGVTAHRIDVVEEWAGLAGGGGGFAGARTPVKPACQMSSFLLLGTFLVTGHSGSADTS